MLLHAPPDADQEVLAQDIQFQICDPLAQVLGDRVEAGAEGSHVVIPGAS